MFLLYVVLYYVVIFIAILAIIWLLLQIILSMAYSVTKKTRPRYVLDVKAVLCIVGVLMAIGLIRFAQLTTQNKRGLNYNRRAALAYASQYKDAVILSHTPNTIVEFPQKPPGIALKYADGTYIDEAVIIQNSEKFFMPETGKCDYYKMIANVQNANNQIESCKYVGEINNIKLYTSGSGIFYGKYKNIALRMYEPTHNLGRAQNIMADLFVTDGKGLQAAIAGPNFNTNYVPWINEWYSQR